VGKGEMEDKEVDQKFAGVVGEVVENAFVALGEMLERPRVL
jgi:hypothetical protein